MEKPISDTSDPNNVAYRGSLLLCIGSLLYHFLFLFLFLFLGVKPMFFFNIGSVLVFVLCLFLLRKQDFIIKVFCISLVEVMLHQILAEYFLGVDAAFHFFMLIMAYTAFFMLRDNRKIAMILCIPACAGFMIMEMLRPILVPVYTISEGWFLFIKSINIFFFILMTVYRIYVYASLTFDLESEMHEKVSVLASEMQKSNEKLIDTQQHAITSFSNLVETRYGESGNHVQRISAYVKVIAEEARKRNMYTYYFTDEKIKVLERAALLHDIGKIVVSDTILKKPGRLTSDEFTEIKKHAAAGGRIIREVFGESDDKEFLSMAYEIAVNHHEHWDGTGYPSGKKGVEIPLSARLLAIADVFDALVSKRCYKDAVSEQEAFKIIEEGSGTQFDPELSEVFLASKERVSEIRKSLKD